MFPSITKQKLKKIWPKKLPDWIAWCQNHDLLDGWGLQGFCVYNACGGGTGSGLGCLMLERLPPDGRDYFSGLWRDVSTGEILMNVITNICTHMFFFVISCTVHIFLHAIHKNIQTYRIYAPWISLRTFSMLQSVWKQDQIAKRPHWKDCQSITQCCNFRKSFFLKSVTPKWPKNHHHQRKFRNLTSDYTESCCWRSVNQEMWSRRCDTAEMWDIRDVSKQMWYSRDVRREDLAGRNCKKCCVFP